MTLGASPEPGSRPNTLAELRFGTMAGALVEVPGRPSTVSGDTHVLPPNTTQTQFTVRQAAAGQAATVQLTVMDGCGGWPTFVGGGPSAFQ